MQYNHSWYALIGVEILKLLQKTFLILSKIICKTRLHHQINF